MKPWLLLLASLLPAQRADWAVSAQWVVTMDADRRVLENGAVAVRQNRIVGVGPASEILTKFRPRQRLDAGHTILMPGLINTHTHAPMSLLRGIADDLALQDWLEKFIFPAEAKNVSPEFVRWGTYLACAEMALSGTTLFTDMYYFEEVIAAATTDCGLRGVLGQSVIGFPVSDAANPSLALQRAEVFLQRYRDDPRITPAVAPHAIYTTSDETLKQARQLANRYGAPLLIHLAETKREFDDALAQRAKTPTRTLEDLGLFEGRTLVAHAVWLTPQDRDILARRGVGVAHCPSSNMKLASGVAPVLEMLAQGIPVGLGPDGPAGSNNDFDLLEEASLAANLQKVTRLDPRALPAQTAVEMLTLNGARALGMQADLGSLEIGKKADLITLSLDAPRAQPLFNVYSQIVNALKGSDVRNVMVDGRWVVRDGRLLTLNLAEIRREVERWRARIAESVQQN
jgi:5-methylthioadenosine/S-adenosylhomocysteine deaminase